eukprot:2075853-Rhodomonas_salina.1
MIIPSQYEGTSRELFETRNREDTKNRSTTDSIEKAVKSIEVPKLLDEPVLLGDLHQRSTRKGGIDISACGHAVNGLVEGHELEVVELALGQLVIEVLHLFPGAIPDTDHHDRDGVLGSFDDRSLCLVFAAVRDLPVGNDDEDVVGPLFFDRLDGLADHRREVGGPSQ